MFGMSLFGQSASSKSPRRLPFCGCYIWVQQTRRFLPKVKVDVHTTILDTVSRTTLTQTFVNLHKDKDLDELQYDFPLYDGVSVVGFTCTIGSRVIEGVVKERMEARREYTKAKARGEKAGLLEQSIEAADVFTTTIGNVPAGQNVKVEITYLGELKHDAEIDGVRFTIPTHIVPRYGSAESLQGKGDWIKEDGISITVDAEMPDGSAIKSVQSPSHPLSVSIGTTSKTTASDEPSLRKASATLSQGSASLDKDFIIQIVATKMGEPAAFLETHPTWSNHRALMTTLVPKFKLPAEKPEIVFICDRSGSMTGNITDLVAALNIFLKSLPLGVKFNICSFGSRFSFLWPKSKSYSQESLDQAVRHVNGFEADYGGTQMYEPFKATFKQRYQDMNLEVFLLTDGEIWDQQQLFELINEQMAESKGSVRVFSLGVGSGASSSLIEGVARAGNGFAQTVDNGEKMDKKVVRMLKGALFPHITDYRLEIKYEKTEDKAAEEDDFEIVEKVLDSLSIKTLVEDEPEKKDGEKPSISLFDRNVDDDGDKEMPDAEPDLKSKYDHLPKVPIPRYLQTPSEIPPLYPFNRTTIYVLLSDATPNKKPKSVLLKATSKHGPLVLEIPVVNLPEKSDTIHKLAARKEVKELEEGRGWISFAKDDSGTVLKSKYKGQFSDMAEREAVRLGVQYQVGGKFCSFVAVEKTSQGEKELDEFETVKSQEETSFGGAPGGFARVAPRSRMALASKSASVRGGKRGGVRNRSDVRCLAPDDSSDEGEMGFGLFDDGAPPARSPPSSGGLFGSAPPPPPGGAPAPATSSSLFGAAPSSHSSSFGSSLFGGAFGSSGAQPSMFGNSTAFGAPASMSSSNFQPPTVQAAALMPGPAPTAKQEEEVLLAANMPLEDLACDEEVEAVRIAPSVEKKEKKKKSKAGGLFGRMSSRSSSSNAPDPSIDTSNPLQALTTLQTFVGSWSWDVTLEKVLGVTSDAVSKLSLPDEVTSHADKNTILATACAVMFFKKKLKADEEAWEMLVDKAEAWLEDQIGESKDELEKVIGGLF